MDQLRQKLESQILQNLQEKCPGELMVSPGQALVVAGITTSKNPERAARQLIQRKTFPFPVVILGSTRRVLLAAMAEVIAKTPAFSPAVDPAVPQDEQAKLETAES